MPNRTVETVAGVGYYLPTVTVLQQSPLLVGELAGRTAYDSFDNSEHEVIRNFSDNRVSELDSESSNLLDSLAWVHHHHSVLEHISLTYLIRGTSRSVLQELVRHRIASYTVRSTRYTMQKVLHAFNASNCTLGDRAIADFTDILETLDMFVVTGSAFKLEARHLFEKLKHQMLEIGRDEFHKLTMSKEAQSIFKGIRTETPNEIYEALTKCKSKRNVGDNFKWCVTDNWSVDLVVTFNLRSLRNYFTLRLSGAAYFQIQWLSSKMKEVTPAKYLNLIIKD